MGCRILYSSRDELAALYCSTSDVAFGPVFYAEGEHDAEERAEAFMRWIIVDPRTLDEPTLMRKHSEWRAQEIAQYGRENPADCEACDNYVLNASEAPFCPSCARERSTK